MQPQRIDTFYVLDFDRTLIDSDILAHLIYSAAEPFLGRSPEALVRLQKEAEKAHDSDPSISIDMWSIMLDCLGSEVDAAVFANKIVERVHPAAGVSYLPGATKLLDKLREANKLFMIMTKGEPGWQEIKLQCMGLDNTPHQVVSSYKKALYLNDWRKADGYHIPVSILGGQFIADRLILIDDRSVGFEDANEAIQGYFVRTGRDKHGNVPVWIRTIDSLDEVAGLE